MSKKGVWKVSMSRTKLPIAAFSAIIGSLVFVHAPGATAHPPIPSAPADFLFSTGMDTDMSDEDELSAVSISAGYYSTCAVMSDTTVRCWGDNTGGQLGNPAFGYQAVAHAIPVLADGVPLTGVSQIAVGNWHACAIAGPGVKCWGSNFSGQLGFGTIDPETVIQSPESVPSLILGDESVLEIAAGKEHTCALLSNAQVKCWGFNNVEQAGQPNPDHTNETIATPAVVDLGGAAATHIVAGAYYTCALTNVGLQCWGSNTFGELGRTLSGALWDLPGPSATELQTVTNIVGGTSANHACAGGLGLPYSCWGRNELGQLGNGTNDYMWSPNPVPTSMLEPVFDKLASGALNSCGLHGGAVYCVGDNSAFQLATVGVAYRSAPLATPIENGAADVAVGVSHVCAIVGGHVKCWGTNEDGALGRDVLCSEDYPVPLCSSADPMDVVGLTDP